MVRSGAPLTSYSVGRGSLTTWVNRPGHETDSSLPSSDDVNACSCSSSHLVLWWRVQGQFHLASVERCYQDSPQLSVYQPRFERGTSQIQVRSVTSSADSLGLFQCHRTTFSQSNYWLFVVSKFLIFREMVTLQFKNSLPFSVARLCYVGAVRAKYWCVCEWVRYRVSWWRLSLTIHHQSPPYHNVE